MLRKIIILFICVITLFAYLYLQNTWIDIEPFNIEIEGLDEALDGLKIAHISDVHLPKNSVSIQKILSKVESEKPDLIFMTGDLIDSSAILNESGLKELSEGFADIAPTYAVSGNHEIWQGNIKEWKKILENSRIKVVDNTYTIIQHHGVDIGLLGLRDGDTMESQAFKEIEGQDKLLTLLLTHRIESYLSYRKNIIPDVVFSGHIHGGQFRLPISNKGILSPDMSFFPKFTSGLYVAAENENIIISRGLGNSILPVRVNNRVHLPIIVLKVK